MASHSAMKAGPFLGIAGGGGGERIELAHPHGVAQAAEPTQGREGPLHRILREPAGDRTSRPSPHRAFSLNRGTGARVTAS